MWLRECQHFCRESLWCHNKGITLDDHRRSHSHTITWESFVRRCLWDRFSPRVENSSPWLKQVQTRWIAATIFDRLFEKWLFLNLVFVFNFVRFIASVWLCLFMKKEKVFVAGNSSLCKIGRFIWACGEFASENFKNIWFSGRNWLPKWKSSRCEMPNYFQCIGFAWSTREQVLETTTKIIIERNALFIQDSTCTHAHLGSAKCLW